MNDVMEFPTAVDLERREYDRLCVRLRDDVSAEAFLVTARKIAQFLNSEPNPVYGDALVTMLLGHGHQVVLDLHKDPLLATYASLMTKRVSTAALRVESLWRGILGNNGPLPGNE